ncbi:MAG: glycosyltransferase family 39 protein [Bacteroidota bacterium]
MKGISKSTFIKWAVPGIILLRVITLFAVPLLDKTEARYGEIARLMQDTGQWVVLQFDYGIPFWAKPPLSSWLSAFSFQVFGVNEFASRLPSFLIAIAIILILIKGLKLKGISRYVLAFILLTIPEYLLHAGVTSTDSALLLAIVVTMISFWKTISEDRTTIWSYLFFVGIGIGLLAKGPIVIILTGPPLLAWCLLVKGRLRATFRRLPWILGLLIVAAIAVPWYLLAEKESPGFIDYFIVGEHFKRFTESGWSGDKYGYAKKQPLGMIWLFLLAFGFPWIQIVGYQLWKRRKSLLRDPWVSFLLLWMLWTPLFFTISKSVIHTYILPSTVPLGLLALHFWDREKYWVKTASIFPAAVVLALIGITVSNSWESTMNTDKYLIERQEIATKHSDVPLWYWKQKSYSGRFYARRPISVIKDERSLDSLLSLPDRFFIMIPKKREHEVPEELKGRLQVLDTSLKHRLYTNRK